MQATFWILTSEDMAVPGVAQWLCEQGTQPSSSGNHTYSCVISLMARSRTYRAVQPEILARHASVGSVLSGIAAICSAPS
jgi:hypothetical protein